MHFSATKAMGKRREPRVQVDIPVKVCGMDTAGHPFVQTAYALSVSRTGVRLTGVGSLVRTGETIVVIYKQKKARYKVTWVGDVGQPEAGQAGLELAEANAQIWDFSLPYPCTDGYLPPEQFRPFSMTQTTPPSSQSFSAPPPPPATLRQSSGSGVERRSAPRYKCRGSADIFVQNVSFPTRGQIDDISLSGVYIQTTAPLLVGSAVTLNLAVASFTLQAQAEVRTSHPGVGMGLLFTTMTTENRMVLGAVINRLAGVVTPPPRAAAAAAAQEGAIAPALAPRWDAIGREISEWFRTHETLTRDEFFSLIRKQ